MTEAFTYSKAARILQCNFTTDQNFPVTQYKYQILGFNKTSTTNKYIFLSIISPRKSKYYAVLIRGKMEEFLISYENSLVRIRWLSNLLTHPTKE